MRKKRRKKEKKEIKRNKKELKKKNILPTTSVVNITLSMTMTRASPITLKNITVITVVVFVTLTHVTLDAVAVHTLWTTKSFLT